MNNDKKEMGNQYLSSIPESEHVQQQLLKATGSKAKNKSFEALKGLFGLLKDDISDEQFQEMLQDAHL